MYDVLLHPTDGSAGATAAREHAAHLAGTHDAALHLLFVVDTSYLGATAVDGATVRGLRQGGDEVLREAEDALADGDVPVTTAVREGDPHAEIVAYAADEAVDLIVMGTHGRRGLDRYLLGSVAEKVVRTADAPVLTVREPDDS